MYIQETFINRTEDHIIDRTDVYLPWTGDKGKLFTSLQKEYGRCTGKVYVNTKDGKTKAIGWVFEGKDSYTDTKDTYIREVWVVLHKRQPSKVVTHYYEEL